MIGSSKLSHFEKVVSFVSCLRQLAGRFVVSSSGISFAPTALLSRDSPCCVKQNYIELICIKRDFIGSTTKVFLLWSDFLKEVCMHSSVSIIWNLIFSNKFLFRGGHQVIVKGHQQYLRHHSPLFWIRYFFEVKFYLFEQGNGRPNKRRLTWGVRPLRGIRIGSSFP